MHRSKYEADFTREVKRFSRRCLDPVRSRFAQYLKGVDNFGLHQKSSSHSHQSEETGGESPWSENYGGGTKFPAVPFSSGQFYGDAKFGNGPTSQLVGHEQQKLQEPRKKTSGIRLPKKSKARASTRFSWIVSSAGFTI